MERVMQPTGTSMRILLVDDVQLDRMQLAIRLKQLGHIVKAVGSGIEALNTYESFDPELVLLDISMPEMNGFEVSLHVRETFPDWIPIIFLSSHEEPEMIAKAIDAGGDDYLIKPVDKLVLNSKLIAMQRIAHMRRELKQATAQLEQVNQLLTQQANEDGLTKLFNRRYIDQKLDSMVAWHGRHHMPMAMILLDVDFFKPFNDNYGHIEGDRCLQAIANQLKATFCRSGEYVGRYGGEEFVVLLSSTDAQTAEREAERIQEAMYFLDYQHEFSSVANRVTVSQGVFVFQPTGKENQADLYATADRALYTSKSLGRNTYTMVNAS
ncbi:diguanylate cyclase [Vibrio parahaemolyticus]|uniref:diguanylate cyclase n=30 Tax=Vibrionaceae TaxID=641 RepID=A0A2R9VV29_VIBPH|nr:diguanylate cyclase [Vibrio parahaemolyticus O1:K33 str. CDC_K4557]AKU57341.1 Response regulator [Vibrio parahaemolyticus]EDM60569.1 response regulator [Vibrio parahaemolyticus AQ3810]KIS78901.1 diguanylate cyclase [Vibrio parahaemolyticus 97-10290]KIS87075.1 diguanylate cyclase [Vibrio parahaemolyticus EN9701173]KIS89301.1 diguanylate cyclase [Vibrio parahaemolyticus 12315]KIS95477.1 diguanylate cyclase [Vibrio parahaemolyticus 846]KIS98885.1 diguanylate cyclase [Vibrio parahaemolyticus 